MMMEGSSYARAPYARYLLLESVWTNGDGHACVVGTVRRDWRVAVLR